MFKQTSIAFLALLGLNGAAQAQTPGSCAPPSLANTGDLKPVPESNLMTVPVEINGASKRLLLDVGTAPDEISQAAVSELNLAQVDRNTNSNVMAEQSSLLQFQPPFVDV